MRRLKKRIYFGLWAGTLCVLSVVRMCNPHVMPAQNNNLSVSSDISSSDTLLALVNEDSVADAHSADSSSDVTSTVASSSDALHALPEKHSPTVYDYYAAMPRGSQAHYRPIRSVPSYRNSFPDLQDVQIVAAQRWGVRPVKNRAQAEKRKSDLVYVGASPYYDIDKDMNRSIPYLVPRASQLLQDIGRNFLDSLYVKGVPLHKIVVSSVLRTEEDVAKLRRGNVNASEQSCHRFGTTIDICYNRYSTVEPPHGPRRRAVQNDTLKWVLSEVLRDLREQGRCYVKYEVKQACFHLTVR